MYFYGKKSQKNYVFLRFLSTLLAQNEKSGPIAKHALVIHEFCDLFEETNKFMHLYDQIREKCSFSLIVFDGPWPELKNLAS